MKKVNTKEVEGVKLKVGDYVVVEKIIFGETETDVLMKKTLKRRIGKVAKIISVEGEGVDYKNELMFSETDSGTQFRDDELRLATEKEKIMFIRMEVENEI